MQSDERFVKVRHELHRNAAIGFEEHATAAIVARELTSLGLEVTRGIAGTGVVGLLRRGGGGPMIGLRAELDALPMREESGVDFPSLDSATFHGCGHDGHMAMLLAAAARLVDNPVEADIAFIFQPAEEGLGGARAMIADGLFERFDCKEIYALHNDPSRPLGTVALRPGPAMAAADFFDIEVVGRGSHAAHPDFGTDAIVAATAIVQALQTIVSRNIDPRKVAVLSVTRFHAGTAYNVLPDVATLSGTIRALDGSVMDLLRQRLASVAESTASAHGAAATVTFRKVFSALVNHPQQTAAVAEVAVDLFGADRVDPNASATTGSEDFADMLASRPGSYVWLGQGGSAPLHSPRYRFDDALIPIGAALLEGIVRARASALRRIDGN